MKKVLFIGLTQYNLQEKDSHLRNKFEGLSEKIKPFVLARGEPFSQSRWGTDFYLLKPGILFWPSALLVAFYICLKENIDVIVTESPLLDGFVGTIVSKMLGQELIVEVHGDWETAPFLVKERSFVSFKKKVVSWLADFSLNSADKIRAISEFTEKKAQERTKKDKPTYIFPAFTDLDIFLKEKDISFEKFILFVGVLEKVKGIKYLLEAFSRIQERFPGFKLVVVGEGSRRKDLEQVVSSYGIKDKTEFKGRLPLKETKEVMKRCYCLVLPSVSEGLGRVLIEAAALGKPLVGSNVGGIPDIIKDGYNGFLFEKRNVEDLSEKLTKLLKNPELAKEMGRRGRGFVKQEFSNEKYIQNYISMIKD